MSYCADDIKVFREMYAKIGGVRKSSGTLDKFERGFLESWLMDTKFVGPIYATEFVFDYEKWCRDHDHYAEYVVKDAIVLPDANMSLTEEEQIFERLARIVVGGVRYATGRLTDRERLVVSAYVDQHFSVVGAHVQTDLIYRYEAWCRNGGGYGPGFEVQQS